MSGSLSGVDAWVCRYPVAATGRGWMRAKSPTVQSFLSENLNGMIKMPSRYPRSSQGRTRGRQRPTKLKTVLGSQNDSHLSSVQKTLSSSHNRQAAGTPWFAYTEIFC